MAVTIGAMAALAAGAIRPVNELRIDPEDGFDIVPDHPNKGKERPPLTEAKPRGPSEADLSRIQKAEAKRARKAAKRRRDATSSPIQEQGE
ncbi:hypothetical protein [Hwanghaeella sp.]|uniref:hypothetical protein n=1 Tax=Hwanghaeella sp. TaxID=2605943 RepID=UPI003CCC26AB